MPFGSTPDFSLKPIQYNITQYLFYIHDSHIGESNNYLNTSEDSSREPSIKLHFKVTVPCLQYTNIFSIKRDHSNLQLNNLTNIQ